MNCCRAEMVATILRSLAQREDLPPTATQAITEGDEEGAGSNTGTAGLVSRERLMELCESVLHQA